MGNEQGQVDRDTIEAGKAAMNDPEVKAAMKSASSNPGTVHLF